MMKKIPPAPRLAEAFSKMNLTVVTAGFDAALLAIFIFKWRLIASLSGTFYPVLILGLGFFFFVMLTLSVINAVAFFGVQKIKALIPLILNLIIMTLILFIPIDPINVRIRFRRNHTRLTEAVQWIRSQPDQFGLPYIILPDGYADLTVDGEAQMIIESDGTNYFFPILIRPEISTEGFLYLFDTNEIERTPSLYRIKENWYWAEK